jgi:hypothetical protein
MAERTKATVLKTVGGATRPWVRIPLLPRQSPPPAKCASWAWDGVKKRLTVQVVRDFGPMADAVLRRLDELDLPFAEDMDPAALEGVQTSSSGPARRERVERLCSLAEIDWRDVLVAAGLADENWRDRIDEALWP